MAEQGPEPWSASGQCPEEIHRKLSTRCNAEIVARITELERRLALMQGRSLTEFDDEVDRMLRILRSP